MHKSAHMATDLGYLYARAAAHGSEVPGRADFLAMAHEFGEGVGSTGATMLMLLERLDGLEHCVAAAAGVEAAARVLVHQLVARPSAKAALHVPALSPLPVTVARSAKGLTLSQRVPQYDLPPVGGDTLSRLEHLAQAKASVGVCLAPQCRNVQPPPYGRDCVYRRQCTFADATRVLASLFSSDLEFKLIVGGRCAARRRAGQPVEFWPVY